MSGEGLSVSFRRTAMTQKSNQELLREFQGLVYSNKKIIILDEATNALDKKIENKIFNYLKKERDKIIIVISHDLSLQKHCNQVIKIRRKEKNVK